VRGKSESVKGLTAGRFLPNHGLSPFASIRVIDSESGLASLEQVVSLFLGFAFGFAASGRHRLIAGYGFHPSATFLHRDKMRLAG